MRTTIVFDSDVENSIRDLAKETGKSLRDVVNGLIRQAIKQRREKISEPKPFVVKSFPMGLSPGIDPLKFNQLADELDVEESPLRLKMEVKGL